MREPRTLNSLIWSPTLTSGRTWPGHLSARRLIKTAVEANGTVWDYDPPFDPVEGAMAQYLPPPARS